MTDRNAQALTCRLPAGGPKSGNLAFITRFNILSRGIVWSFASPLASSRRNVGGQAAKVQNNIQFQTKIRNENRKDYERQKTVS